MIEINLLPAELRLPEEMTRQRPKGTDGVAAVLAPKQKGCCCAVWIVGKKYKDARLAAVTSNDNNAVLADHAEQQIFDWHMQDIVKKFEEVEGTQIEIEITREFCSGPDVGDRQICSKRIGRKFREKFQPQIPIYVFIVGKTGKKNDIRNVYTIKGNGVLFPSPPPQQ